MTDQEKKEAYLDFINTKTNHDFTLENAPATIKLAVEKLMEMDGTQVNVNSRSQGGRSVTFVDGIPKLIQELISINKKLRWD